MPILAVDGATPVAGVAVVHRGRVLCELFTNHGKTHSETLAVMIDEALEKSGVGRREIEALAVTKGPGSFTGLRIAMATVKGLAMALDLPVVGVPTLEVLAHQVGLASALIAPMLNARKSEVYMGVFAGGLDGLRRLTEDQALSPLNAAELIRSEMARTGQQTVVLTGDGVGEYMDVWQDILGDYVIQAPPWDDRPRAAALGCLGEERWLSGEGQDATSLMPVYIRLPEAEARMRRGE